jgi:hypothetical protein
MPEPRGSLLSLLKRWSFSNSPAIWLQAEHQIRYMKNNKNAIPEVPDWTSGKGQNKGSYQEKISLNFIILT